MGNSISRLRPTGWKTWVCAVAVTGVASSVAVVAAGAVTPTRPGAPKVTSVKAGDRVITVAFAKPAHDGGARVSSYRAKCTSTNKGAAGTRSGTGSPIVVAGLSANKTYRCTVTASNKVGSGPASARSAAVVARPVPPAAPKAPSVKPGTRNATVAFTKPAHDGGAPVSTYRVVCSSKNGGSVRSTQGTKSPIKVGGLAAGGTYRCTVAAGNRIGVGPASNPSPGVVVRPTAPGTPSVKSVRSEWHGVAVAYIKPLNDGGAPITNYRAVCKSSDGGVTSARVAATSPIHVNGLTPGARYTCTVAASNNIKRGPPSKPSKTVIPQPQ